MLKKAQKPWPVLTKLCANPDRSLGIRLWDSAVCGLLGGVVSERWFINGWLHSRAIDPKH